MFGALLGVPFGPVQSSSVSLAIVCGLATHWVSLSHFGHFSQYVRSWELFYAIRSKGMVHKKALYRLKQSPRAWNEKIDALFQRTRFTQLALDLNLYIHRQPGLAMVRLWIHIGVMEHNKNAHMGKWLAREPFKDWT